MCSTSLRGILTALTLLGIAHGVANAQTAQIAGTIMDPSGAVVPGATLTIVNVDTNNTRDAVSNERGQYNVPFLPSALIGHYTFGKSIDLGGAQFISGDLVYRDPRDITRDRGLSSFDVRHNMVLSYIWDIPVGHGRRLDMQNPWLNSIIGGWQFNGITSARSGTPFTPALSFNPAQSGHARPDRIGDGNLPRSERSADLWFDPTAFTAPTPFLIGPGFFNTDIGLFKRFRFADAGRTHEIQIRLEAFNVFNEPHYQQPNATVDLLQAGTIAGIRGTMREMQLGLKVLF
jgi:carboxypeptidase family protein